MAVMSGTLGFGGGTGLVVVGLLMTGDAGYHRVFWLDDGVHRRRHRDRGVARPPPPAHVDTGPSTGSAPSRSRRGAVGGPVGDHPGQLVGLDVTGTLGCTAGGIAVLVGWWLWERRAKQPLVSTGC